MPADCKTIDDVNLSADENSFLLDAFKNWSKPSNFSDEQVAKVKTIFQHIYKTDSPLNGRQFEDALVMQPSDDNTRFYAMEVSEDCLTWREAYVSAKGFQILNSSTTTFDMFLLMVGDFCVPEEKEEKTDIDIMRENFKSWRMMFSKERLTRVAHKNEGRDDAQFIARNEDTLTRMRFELRMLGFKEMREQDKTTLYFNWDNEEALLRGYAPQLFTVSLIDDGYDAEEDHRVFIDEMHGPETLHIEDWEDWDWFLVNQMTPV
jgi:hypothetical protein